MYTSIIIIIIKSRGPRTVRTLLKKKKLLGLPNVIGTMMDKLNNEMDYRVQRRPMHV